MQAGLQPAEEEGRRYKGGVRKRKKKLGDGRRR